MKKTNPFYIQNLDYNTCACGKTYNKHEGKKCEECKFKEELLENSLKTKDL